MNVDSPHSVAVDCLHEQRQDVHRENQRRFRAERQLCLQVRNQSRSHRSSPLHEGQEPPVLLPGRPRMNHYTSEERKARGKRYARYRAMAEKELAVIKAMALSAISEGVPETQIAAELGIDRMTVRKWAGKR